jgi:hypothetical protein
MNRTLSQRLERLESREIPASERRFINVQYVDSTGAVVESRVVEIPTVARDWKTTVAAKDDQ